MLIFFQTLEKNSLNNNNLKYFQRKYRNLFFKLHLFYWYLKNWVIKNILNFLSYRYEFNYDWLRCRQTFAISHCYKCAENHLYRIGLSLFSFGSQTRNKFHNPFFISFIISVTILESFSFLILKLIEKHFCYIYNKQLNNILNFILFFYQLANNVWRKKINFFC